MLRFVVVLCLVSVALGFTLRAGGLDGRIVGGSSTDISKYPYQVSVVIDGVHQCGGSILTGDWILSAAHCFSYNSTSTYEVRVSSSIRDSGGLVFDVDEVITHEYFNGWNYDIALLRLSSPIIFSSTAQPVTLASADEEVAAGTSAVVTGWGLLEEGGSLATVLQEVTVPVVSNEDCKNSYSSMITPQTLCAGAEGRAACSADSGGPLVANGKQIGIVSFSSGCARKNYPTVYANVATLRNWIFVNSGI